MSYETKITRPDGLVYCRSPEYYVDPDSTSFLELGTFKHPFKYLGLAFVDVVNIWTSSNQSVYVNVKESSINFLKFETLYVLNLNLTMRTYNS